MIELKQGEFGASCYNPSTYSGGDGVEGARPPDFIRFGPYEVSLHTQELFKHGRRLRLAPQAFQVLRILLEQPGQLVSREDLHGALWPADTFVDFDHGLNNAIKRIRDVLDDSADAPHYVETLPRLGYRFIGQVDGSGNGNGKAPAAIAERPLVSALVSPELKAPKRSVRFPWAAIVGASIVIAGLTVSGWWFFSRKKHVLTERDTIVVADFANKTGDPVFDDTLKQALTTTLAQSPFLSILSDQRADETLRLMDRPSDQRITPEIAREICLRTGSTVVLTGSIASLGNQYVIGLNATDCASGNSLGREEAQADRKENVLNALGSAAAGLRKKLGESVASIRRFDTPLEVTTSSLEALKIFSDFVRSGGRVPGFPMLQHAIELDPNFAIAYKALSDIYDDLGDTDLASQYAQKAYDMRERATEVERLDITATYCYATLGDLDQELLVYPVWQHLYPRDAGPWINSSEDRAILGDYDRAVTEGQEALRLRPYSYVPYADVANHLVALNRTAEARQTVRLALSSGLDRPDFHLLLYDVAFLENNRREMDAQMALVNSIGGADAVKLLLAESNTEAYFGRLKKSLELSSKAIENAQRGIGEMAAQIRAAEGLWAVDYGYRGEARQKGASALTMSSGRRARALTALLLARTGDTTHAQALADELNRRFPSDTLLQRHWLPTIRGSIQLARGNSARALYELRSVHYELGNTRTPIGNLYPIYVRGEAYLAARQGKEAAAEFQKILDHPSIILNSPVGALAHLGLARAYSLEGDLLKARAAYAGFLTLWKSADPDLPLLRQAKAEYQHCCS